MQFAPSDVMRFEVPRDGFFSMSDHHPIVAGVLPDGRPSYMFGVALEDGIGYVASGPAPEELRFVRRKLDGGLVLSAPSPSSRVYAWVLRYEPDAYMHCEYYASKMRAEDVGIDSTGPFSWKLRRYLPAFYQAPADINIEAIFVREDTCAKVLLPDSKDEDLSIYDPDDDH